MNLKPIICYFFLVKKKSDSESERILTKGDFGAVSNDVMRIDCYLIVLRNGNRKAWIVILLILIVVFVGDQAIQRQ